MARYFDPQILSHERLLHSSIRSHDELEATALEVEREIILEFTERDLVAETFEVKLTDWDSDPTAVEERFRKAFRGVIANVVSHRLRFFDATRNVKSETLGSYSVTYGDRLDPKWPPGWDAPLSLWDERTPAWFA